MLKISSAQIFVCFELIGLFAVYVVQKAWIINSYAEKRKANSKTCVKWPLKNRQNKDLNNNW